MISATAKIKETFSALGFSVLIINETATQLINSGIAPWTCPTASFYQNLQMRLHLEKERIFEEAAENMATENVLIVCDRGIPDCRAYMTNDEYLTAVTNLGFDEKGILGRYDAVFHLVSAADGAEEFYSVSNNSARTETAEEAVILDNKVKNAWSNHPYCRIIDNSVGFDAKIDALISEIMIFFKISQE